uniref:Uncharacterized protein n=1 Tax=Vitis vinifera TaxID=29760 RepID=F6HTK9_VITVI
MGIDPNFNDESSLLGELGINNQQIWSKMVLILNPFRVNPNLHKDTDLWGPFLLLMSFGLFQLLTEKIHLGIILGWVTVAALFLYVVFNMLVGRNGNLDLYRKLLLSNLNEIGWGKETGKKLVALEMSPMVDMEEISMTKTEPALIPC